jgi:hypothetical protein
VQQAQPLVGISHLGDRRIVFAFEPDPQNEEEMIVLIDVGTHDEVY